MKIHPLWPEHSRGFYLLFNGDLEFGEEMDEEGTTGLLSPSDSLACLLSASLSIVPSTACFTAGRDSLAFPLAVLQIQARSWLMREKSSEREMLQLSEEIHVWFWAHQPEVIFLQEKTKMAPLLCQVSTWLLAALQEIQPVQHYLFTQITF